MFAKLIKGYLKNSKDKPQVSCNRDLSIRKFNKNEYATLRNYLDQDTYDTELSTIWFNGVPLDLIFQFDSVSKPLFVFFHGAVDQSKTVTPHFVGLSYKRRLSANMLHFADASLFSDDSIRAGWYLGCKHIHMQNVMKSIVIRLASKLGTNKIVFFGSSGGGFPSLCLSQAIPDSLAIVNSPATSVSKHPHRSTRVSQYLKAAFGTESEEAEEQVLKDVGRSDLREGFDTSSGTVLYLLNINDTGNIKLHTSPFFQQFKQDTSFSEKQIQRFGNVYLLTNDWGPGHRYPPARFLSNLFSKVAENKTDWSGDGFLAELRKLSGL